MMRPVNTELSLRLAGVRVCFRSSSTALRESCRSYKNAISEAIRLDRLRAKSSSTARNALRSSTAIANITRTMMLASSTLRMAVAMASRRKRERGREISICPLRLASLVEFSWRWPPSSRSRSVTRPKRLDWERINRPSPEMSATGQMLACSSRVKPSKFSMCTNTAYQIPVAAKAISAARPPGRGPLAPLDICRVHLIFAGMVETTTPEILPDIGHAEQTGGKTSLEPGYLVICWNDPVNFMDYVTHVFQKVFC